MWRKQMLILSVAVVSGIGIAIGFGPHGFGHAPMEVSSTFSSCALVGEILGDHPSAAWFGGTANRVFGSDRDSQNRSNTPPGHEGWAYGSYAVGGSRASGTFEYVAYFDKGAWVIDRAILKAEAQTIDVLHCYRLN